MQDGPNTDKPLFRVQIELVDGDITTFDNLPGEQALECVRRFVLREGSGLDFASGTGTHSWAWDEIRGVGALRMVALFDVETQPALRRILMAG